MKKTNIKRWLRYLGRFGVTLFGILLAAIILLYQIDENELWKILPGVTSSEETQIIASASVKIIENMDPEVKETHMGAGMALMGLTAFVADTSKHRDADDLVLVWYSIALGKAALAEKNGGMTKFEYEALKLPYKTGNTFLMRKVMPFINKRVAAAGTEDISNISREK